MQRVILHKLKLKNLHVFKFLYAYSQLNEHQIQLILCLKRHTTCWMFFFHDEANILPCPKVCGIFVYCGDGENVVDLRRVRK